MRNGSLKYTIIDENSVKTILKNLELSPQSLEHNTLLLSHIRLPRTNEIICVDDLDLAECLPSKIKDSFTSHVTWCYPKRRGLTNFRINQLPFVGESPGEQGGQPAAQLKCFLEYFNECSKTFCLLKEFYIREGVSTNPISHKSTNDTFSKTLTFAKCWRIRLSSEAKRFIYASSLLASTRVDSIELTNFGLSIHAELKLNNAEFKLNTSNENSTDLFAMNLSDLGVRCVYDVSDVSNRIELSLYGQLAADYCEYKFLTNRPLIDPFQFKINAVLGLNKLLLECQADIINLLISQSALSAIKHLQNEWGTSGTTVAAYSPTTAAPHFYLIHNRTNTPLNIKQFDTEETYLIRQLDSLPYTWRTHKKTQLLQVFMPKYCLSSGPFQIDTNGHQEIRLGFKKNANQFVSCIVHIEQAASDCIHKKNIYLESKLVVCNYLNASIDQLYFSYECDKQVYELSSGSIPSMSRSTSTFELIESIQQETLHFYVVEINNSKIVLGDLYNQLLAGILCHDLKLKRKYWLSLCIHHFREVAQYNLVLTPLFVFCSYLPYDLSVEFIDGKSGMLSISANSIEHVDEESLLENNNKVSIKFGNSIDNSKPSEATPNRFDADVVFLNETNFKVSECVANQTKLKYANLYEFKTIVQPDAETKRGSGEKIELNIMFNNSKEIISLPKEILDESATNLQRSKQFLIEKSQCWSFLPTIRVDIKPTCLLVNKTAYTIKLVEKLFNRTTLEALPDDVQESYVDANNGQVCLSDSTNGLKMSNTIKKCKFSVSLEEFSILDSINLSSRTKSSKF